MTAPPFIPVANTVRVQFYYSYGSLVMMNVFHVTSNAPFSASDIVTLRTTMINWFTAQLRAYLTTGVALFRVRSTALDGMGSPFEDYAVSPVITGTGSTGIYPPQVSKCFKLSTGLSGRSYRGRFYIPGVRQDLASTTDIGGTMQTGIPAVFTALRTALTAANSNWKHCVVSYRTGKAWRSNGLATPITSVVAVNTHLDVQRRRAPGRGM